MGAPTPSLHRHCEEDGERKYSIISDLYNGVQRWYLVCECVNDEGLCTECMFQAYEDLYLTLEDECQCENCARN